VYFTSRDSILLCAFHIVYKLLGVIIAVTGMSTVGTSVFSLLPAILEEVLGPQAVISAMGIGNLYRAAAFLASTPIAGKLFVHAEKEGLATFGWLCCHDNVFLFIDIIWIKNHQSQGQATDWCFWHLK